jgi:hypothetical protein
MPKCGSNVLLKSNFGSIALVALAAPTLMQDGAVFSLIELVAFNPSITDCALANQTPRWQPGFSNPFKNKNEIF